MEKSAPEEKYYSSDEEQWEVLSDPVINIFSCGWAEDGRCGYAPDKHKELLIPFPFANVRNEVDSTGRQYVCKRASAGSRHSVLLMINCRKETGRFGRKRKKVVLAGLNQVGLCEEEGQYIPYDLNIDRDEVPIQVYASYGNTFILTKVGNVYSCGYNRYGILGHGVTTYDNTMQIPRQIMELNQVRVKSVALGRHHALALAYNGKIYSWGRNTKGQLGHGFDSEYEILPRRIEYFSDKDVVTEISCGFEHSIVHARVMKMDKSIPSYIYAWGDHSRGQLGSGDIR